MRGESRTRLGFSSTGRALQTPVHSRLCTIDDLKRAVGPGYDSVSLRRLELAEAYK